MTRVLVTGGTGFIGRHLIRRLVEQGDQVRCLVRPVERCSARVPQGVGVGIVTGNLLDARVLDAALADVEIVYHLAGATQPLHKKSYRIVNVEGAGRLAEACARCCRPPIVVSVSSLAAAGPSVLGRPRVETDAAQPVSDYGRSKLGGERRLRAVAGSVPITVLRPPGVVGPGDLYAVRLFRMTRFGIALFPGSASFELSWLYVDDLVEAALLAAEKGQRLAPPGGPNDQGVYFIALDQAVSIAEAAALTAEAQGRRLRWSVAMPGVACKMAAQFNEFRRRLLHRTYWVNPDKMREALAGSWTCSPEKAKRELGYACRVDLREAFSRCVHWYQDQGWL